MAWLPSSPPADLVHTGTDIPMLSDLYRITAALLHKQKWHVDHMGTEDPRRLNSCEALHLPLQRSELAGQGVRRIQELLQGPTFKSTLLWPIGIIMRDLIPEQVVERESLIDCLDSLSGEFHLKHFARLRASLKLSWSRPFHSRSRLDQSSSPSTFTSADTLLLG